MSWIKNVLLDLIILFVAVAGALFGQTWAWWVLAVYTPLMIILKALAVAGGAVLAQMQVKRETPPVLFFHAVYGAITVLMVYAGWWLLAVGWAAIWMLSALAERRALKPVARASASRR
jgi:hypothetical protein